MKQSMEDRRWAAVTARDAAGDGSFVYGVKTTGVYCRPSCAGRPKRENVSFHDTVEDARAAGLRACKRCKPDCETIRYTVGQSALGVALIAQSAKGICAILLGDSKVALVRDLKQRFAGAMLINTGNKLPADVLAQIESPAHDEGLKLDLRGTDFQTRVWQALRTIPAGRTASYADVARRLGQPRAVRAVAQACAANPVAIAVPCHRVVKSDGSLSGYRWGTARKEKLLAQEAAA